MTNWPFKYFKPEELACPCCGENKIGFDLVTLLDDGRETLQFPFIINSGYRCKKHNKEVGGKDNSAHLRGYAADVRITTSRKRYLFLAWAFSKKIKRIFIYPTFIHIDIDPNLPQMVLGSRMLGGRDMRRTFTGVKLWIRGLASAAIGGAATAVATMVTDPETFNLQEGLAKVATVATVSAIVAVANYLKQSPLPED